MKRVILRMNKQPRPDLAQSGPLRFVDWIAIKNHFTARIKSGENSGPGPAA